MPDILVFRLCTPYLAPSQLKDKWIPDELFVKKLPNFGYQMTFASQEGEDLLARNVRLWYLTKGSALKDNLLYQLNGFLIPSFAQVVRPDLDKISGQRQVPWTYPGEFLKRLHLLESRRKQGQSVWCPTRQADPVGHIR